MARASIIQTNFTSGELSPRVAYGRMDVAKYANGVKRLENCIVSIQGGAFRRPGTRFIGEVKSSGVARLISFIYSRSQAYVLAMGAGYARFYRNRARVGTYEITTPYTVSQIWDVAYVQKSDTAFFAHPSVYPQRLQRFADATWTLGNVPFNTEPFAEVGDYPPTSITFSALTGDVTATVPSGTGWGWETGDEFREVQVGAGRGTLISVSSATVATLRVTQQLPSLSAASGGWQLLGTPKCALTPSAAGVEGAVITLTGSKDCWRTSDVGKFVSINAGLVKIDSYTSSTVVSVTVQIEVTSDAIAPTDSWVLMANSWSATRGYPRTVTINKQRLYFANSAAFPQMVWGSEIQGYLSFRLGSDDDQAFAFELDGATNSPIVHLAPARRMLVMTESDEMSITGTGDASITPSNIDKNDESSAGSSGVRPIKIGNEVLIVSADLLKVHAIGYRYDIDGFSAPDRTIFAEHITTSGIKQFTFEKLDKTLMAVRTDGVMAVCSYDVEQEVVGWGRWITQGAFESAATIPTSTAEDTYVIVARTVNGTLKRYIEVFDRDVYLDCAVLGTDATGKTTWTGLDHLEGMTVQVRADGAYGGQYVVSGGSITLATAAKSVQIGLAYTPEIELLQPELGGNGTTSQGNPVSVASVIVRVLDTQALQINGNDIEFRSFDTDVLDMEPPTVTGDYSVQTLGDSIYTTKQVISQPYPAPFHVLDVIRKLTVND